MGKGEKYATPAIGRSIEHRVFKGDATKERLALALLPGADAGEWAHTLDDAKL